MNIRYTQLTAAALLLAAVGAPLHAQGDDGPPPPPSAHTLDRPIPAAAPASATLRYKFTVGQIIRYRNVSDIDMKITIPAQNKTIPINQHFETVLSQTVQSVDPVKNTATLSIKVESIQGTVNGQAMPQSDIQKAQKDAAATLVMTTLGKVVSANLSADAPGMNGKDLGFYQQSGILPVRAVKPGDTWTSVIDVSGVGAKIASNFQLAELKASDNATVAIVKQTAMGAITSKAGGTLPAGVKLNGNINMTGEIQFDTTAGSIKSQSISGQFDAKVSTPAAAKPGAKTAALKKKAPAAAPTTSKLHMDMTTTMTRLDEAIPSAATEHPSP